MIISIRMSPNSIILSKTQDRVSSIKWACFESVLNSINLWISGFSWILSLFYMINYRFWASWRKSVTPFFNFFQLFWVQQTNKQTSRQANRQTDIEHGFFEASTQKAPSGQKIMLFKLARHRRVTFCRTFIELSFKFYENHIFRKRTNTLVRDFCRGVSGRIIIMFSLDLKLSRSGFGKTGNKNPRNQTII